MAGIGRVAGGSWIAPAGCALRCVEIDRLPPRHVVRLCPCDLAGDHMGGKLRLRRRLGRNRAIGGCAVGEAEVNDPGGSRLGDGLGGNCPIRQRSGRSR
jgi:hypothetical protein